MRTAPGLLNLSSLLLLAAAGLVLAAYNQRDPRTQLPPPGVRTIHDPRLEGTWQAECADGNWRVVITQSVLFFVREDERHMLEVSVSRHHYRDEWGDLDGVVALDRIMGTPATYQTVATRMSYSFLEGRNQLTLKWARPPVSLSHIPNGRMQLQRRTPLQSAAMPGP